MSQLSVSTKKHSLDEEADKESKNKRRLISKTETNPLKQDNTQNFESQMGGFCIPTSIHAGFCVATPIESGSGQPISTPAFGQSAFGEPNSTPAFGEPAFGQPAFGQPAFGQSRFGEPAFGQPAFGQPAFGEPAFRRPGFGQPAFRQPAFGQPAFRQPAFGQSKNTNSSDTASNHKLSHSELDIINNHPDSELAIHMSILLSAIKDDDIVAFNDRCEKIEEIIYENKKKKVEKLIKDFIKEVKKYSKYNAFIKNTKLAHFPNISVHSMVNRLTSYALDNNILCDNLTPQKMYINLENANGSLYASMSDNELMAYYKVAYGKDISPKKMELMRENECYLYLVLSNKIHSLFEAY